MCFQSRFAVPISVSLRAALGTAVPPTPSPMLLVRVFNPSKSDGALEMKSSQLNVAALVRLECSLFSVAQV